MTGALIQRGVGEGANYLLIAADGLVHALNAKKTRAAIQYARGKPGDKFTAACSTSRSNGLLAVYQRYQHLDRVLRECASADDPIYQSAAALWIGGRTSRRVISRH